MPSEKKNSFLHGFNDSSSSPRSALRRIDNLINYTRWEQAVAAHDIKPNRIADSPRRRRAAVPILSPVCRLCFLHCCCTLLCRIDSQQPWPLQPRHSISTSRPSLASAGKRWSYWPSIRLNIANMMCFFFSSDRYPLPAGVSAIQPPPPPPSLYIFNRTSC